MAWKNSFNAGEDGRREKVLGPRELPLEEECNTGRSFLRREGILRRSGGRLGQTSSIRAPYKL